MKIIRENITEDWVECYNFRTMAGIHEIKT